MSSQSDKNKYRNQKKSNHSVRNAERNKKNSKLDSQHSFYSIDTEDISFSHKDKKIDEKINEKKDEKIDIKEEKVSTIYQNDQKIGLIYSKDPEDPEDPEEPFSDDYFEPVEYKKK
jgi:hypothetical protein